MDLKTPISVREIAELTNSTLIGNDQIEILSLNEIHKVKYGSLTFVDIPKYYDRALYSAASVILINKEAQCPEGKALLLNDNPFEAYNALAKRFRPAEYLSAMLSDTATVGEGTIIEPNAIIGNHVKIGKNCLIRSNVVISDYTCIGDDVIINPNTVVGSDAFYYKKTAEGYQKWHSIGRVIIRNNVEIGANCTIDRGVSGDTIIGEGTKIDNMVHIGHGVVIGKHCLIAAQVGIAGKTHLQDYVTLFGQVGVSKGLVIGEGAIVMAQSGVSKSLQGGKAYFGSPAGESMLRFKESVALRRLPEFLKEYDRSHSSKSEPEVTEFLGPEFGEAEE